MIWLWSDIERNMHTHYAHSICEPTKLWFIFKIIPHQNGEAIKWIALNGVSKSMQLNKLKTKERESAGEGNSNHAKPKKNMAWNSHPVQMAELRSNATIVRQTGGFLGDAQNERESRRTNALHAMANLTKLDLNSEIRIQLYFNICSILRVESVRNFSQIYVCVRWCRSLCQPQI